MRGRIFHGPFAPSPFNRQRPRLLHGNFQRAEWDSKIFRIGFVVLSSPATTDAWMKAFRGELRTLGYEDGRNLKIESRFAMAIVTC